MAIGLASGSALLCSVCHAQDLQDDAWIDVTRIHLDGELFCEVVTGPASPYGEIPRPLIYPIIGPTGAAMTRGYPLDESNQDESHDHPHHKSFWFAHGDVNGVDFWAQGEGKGRIVCTDVFGGPGDSAIESDLGQIVIAFSDWVAPDETVLLTDQQIWQFSVDEDGTRAIGYSIVLTPGPGVEQVVFGDTKEGTMAIRTHPALRLVGDFATGNAVNSESDTDGELWGKRASWVAYWGEIDGETCGVAIFEDPYNPRYPTWWHARDYGLIAANPFGAHDFEDAPEGTGDYTLESGETLTLQYRFVFFAGDAEEADIAGKYEQWVEETTENEDVEE